MRKPDKSDGAHLSVADHPVSPDHRSRLVRAWAKARAELPHGSPLKLLGLLGGRALSRLVQRRTLYFFERDLAKPAPEFRARTPVDVRMAAREDLETFRDALLEAGARWEEIEKRRARGDLCFAALVDGRLAHFMWLTHGPSPIPAIGLTILIGPREAIVYSSYTDPTLRGLAIQPAVANFMIRHEQALGLERHYFYVLSNNEAGRKIVTGRHAPAAAQATRVLTCVHVPFLGGALLRGLDSPGRPRLQVTPGFGARRLGRLGVWISGRSIDLRAL